MINDTGKIPDTTAGQRAYLKRFYNWAVKLPELDMRACVMFCQQVQAAWVQGQKDAAEAAKISGQQATGIVLDEAEHQGEPKLILPGLGGDPAGGSFIKHQDAPGGMSYGDLDSLMDTGAKRDKPN